MLTPNSKTAAILRALAYCYEEHYPVGLTRGDLRRAAGLPTDTEVTRPIRDLRKHPYRLTIFCDEFIEDGKRVWRYRIAATDIPKARQITTTSLAEAPNRTDESIAEATSPASIAATDGLPPTSVAQSSPPQVNTP